MGESPIEERPGSDDLRRIWDPVWRRQRAGEGWRHRWRRLGGRDAVHRLVRRTLWRELAPAPGQLILEAGSGSGLVSLELARHGCRVCLLDVSTQALELARETFLSSPTPYHLVAARVEELPLASDVFDAVWSGGVLEHIPAEERDRALEEMFRVVRPGGRVVVLHPSARAGVYLRAKEFADRHSSWQAGEEEPIATMVDAFARIPRASGIAEYSVGLLVQFHFLKYYLEFWRPFYLGWCLLVELLHLPLGWLNRFAGYLLVTAARKR